jgi:exopolysaccharide biosynthesis polyprenyl glycosylphosphotransferase
MNASRLEKILNLCVDVVAVTLVFLFLNYVYLDSEFLGNRIYGVYLFSFLYWFVLFGIFGFWRKWRLQSRMTHLVTITKAVGVGSVISGSILFGTSLMQSFLWKQEWFFLKDPLVQIWILYIALLLSILAVGRIGFHSIIRRLLYKGWGADKVLIFGCDQSGEKIYSQLLAAPDLGQRVAGFVSRKQHSPSYHDLPVWRSHDNLEKIIQDNNIQGIVLTHEIQDHEEIFAILSKVVHLPIHIYLVPDLYDVALGHFRGDIIHGVDLKELFPQQIPQWQTGVKRLVDILISGTLLLLSLPLLLITAIAIKLDSKGPVFYSQERVGLYGRVFHIFKFRSMVIDAETSGAQWATKNDSRVTSIGKIIRKTRIDEIPQFICVLKGEMSMVGPRPERPVFVDKFLKEIPLYGKRLCLKPGLTGWAQVRHHYDVSEESVQTKLKYDLYYFENMSPLLDLQILARTIWVVVSGHGAL